MRAFVRLGVFSVSWAAVLLVGQTAWAQDPNVPDTVPMTLGGKAFAINWDVTINGPLGPPAHDAHDREANTWSFEYNYGGSSDHLQCTLIARAYDPTKMSLPPKMSFKASVNGTRGSGPIKRKDGSTVYTRLSVLTFAAPSEDYLFCRKTSNKPVSTPISLGEIRRALGDKISVDGPDDGVLISGQVEFPSRSNASEKKLASAPVAAAPPCDPSNSSCGDAVAARP